MNRTREQENVKVLEPNICDVFSFCSSRTLANCWKIDPRIWHRVLL